MLSRVLVRLLREGVNDEDCWVGQLVKPVTVTVTVTGESCGRAATKVEQLSSATVMKSRQA